MLYMRVLAPCLLTPVRVRFLMCRGWDSNPRFSIRKTGPEREPPQGVLTTTPPRNSQYYVVYEHETYVPRTNMHLRDNVNSRLRARAALSPVSRCVGTGQHPTEHNTANR